MEHTKLLTVSELADRTGLPASWIRREADACRLPHIRVGRSRMFDLRAVMKVLAKRQDCEMSRATSPDFREASIGFLRESAT